MDGPLATMKRAQELVALERQRRPRRDGPITVALRGGVYYLDEPVVFAPKDSGSENSPTIYEAFEGEQVTLSGGRKISDWRVAQDGCWHKTLAAVRAGTWSFSQLFVNGRRRFRPHLPKSGYFKIARKVSKQEFEFQGNDLRSDWPDLHDVEILAFHDWEASRLRIKSIDAARHHVTFTGPSTTEFVEGNRYLVDNAPATPLQPGEWRLDAAHGELIYAPMKGETPDQSEVIAPLLERLLVFQGDLMRRHWVEHIQFRGLGFAHANWILPSAGQSFGQAEIGLKAAIVAYGTRHLTFRNCALRHVGGYAIAFGVGSQNNAIENCEFDDLGGGGVKIGYAIEGTWQNILRLPSDPDFEASHNILRDCLIAHGGRLHPGAVAVWIGQASYNSVEHNDIVDFYQIGISVGWTWGYGPSAAHHNDVGFNRVRAIGQGVTSDLGGIYTLGKQPETIIHDNYVADIRSFAYGGWGLYADEGSSDIRFERNFVIGAQSGGYFQHYGADNRVANNIFVEGGDCQLHGTQNGADAGYVFERNIVYWNNSSPLFCGASGSSLGSTDAVVMDRNLYWRANGDDAFFPGSLEINSWRRASRRDRQSIVADPLFANAPKGDFRLLPATPSHDIGFEPFDAESAGRRQPGNANEETSPRVFP
ncbi:right-handed parallel beta-helix repeat-containing protein [Rhodoblastus sp.]|uniref:right-handed parallel beta-helix repeat-containing protein n=1 Tax=Rhodoblastus sp. TaxID=1962975 RepID=UPI003F95FAE7